MVILWNLCLLNDHVKVERIVQKVLRLELFFLVHLFTQILGPSFICGDHVDIQLSALIVLPNNRKGSWVVKHI